MSTWLNLLAVLGAALLAAASPVTDGVACDIDAPGLTESPVLKLMLLRMQIETCTKDAMTEEMLAHVKEAKDLVDFQNIYKEFCSHVAQMTTCMAGVRERLAHCQNKNITMLFMIVSEVSDHLLTAGCENDGERLAYITHAVHLIAKKRDTILPFRRCFFKAVSFINLAGSADLDLASKTYILYKTTTKLKRCTKHLENEAYNAAVQWMMDEILTTLKCKHPEEERLIPCSEVDVSKLSISNECHIKPLKQENLYDQLEGMAIKGCYGKMFNHDQRANSRHTDLEWLKEEYKTMCHAQRELPECTLAMSAIGETCLSQEEDKQFQLELQALEDAKKRACVEDGARLAEIMHHVYAITPERGHAIRDCYKSVVEASAAHEGHAVSTKTMRFYHDATAFWQCIVGKLHENNDFVQTVDPMMHDVLKKMKCVNPEDGAVVPCESIHEHH